MAQAGKVGDRYSAAQPGAQATHDGLPFPANVEQPAMKRHRNGQAR